MNLHSALVTFDGMSRRVALRRGWPVRQSRRRHGDGTWSARSADTLSNFNNPANWTPGAFPRERRPFLRRADRDFRQPTQYDRGRHPSRPAPDPDRTPQHVGDGAPGRLHALLQSGPSLTRRRDHRRRDHRSQAGATQSGLPAPAAIKGNVTQFQRALGASRGAQGERVLKIVGTIRL